MAFMTRALAIIYFIAGIAFGAAFLVLFVTKISSLFSQWFPALAMVAFAIAAFACFRASSERWRAAEEHRRVPTP
jgi:hypothetical protein